jgi:hypothetical protein
MGCPQFKLRPLRKLMGPIQLYFNILYFQSDNKFIVFLRHSDFYVYLYNFFYQVI